jgi:uncharacterized protein YqhQ
MASDPLRMPNYGGQALIEGILMRGKKTLAAAFRTPEGKIVIKTEELAPIYSKPYFQWPFIRGLLLLWDAMVLGFRYLTISANFQTEEDEKIEGPLFYVTIVFSLGLAVLFFFVLPALLGKLLASLLGWDASLVNLIEGFIRIGFVIFYLWIIGRSKEIRRVFMYHGAEHKTINAFEARIPLEISSVQQCSMQHPRCGTSFILTVMIVSLFVFFFIGNLSLPIMILTRLVLLIPIVMISYEYIRWTSSHLDNAFVRWLATPNLALQKLTTSPPTDEMVEVALAAFKKMLEIETASTGRA